MGKRDVLNSLWLKQLTITKKLSKQTKYETEKGNYRENLPVHYEEHDNDDEQQRLETFTKP